MIKWCICGMGTEVETPNWSEDQEASKKGIPLDVCLSKRTLKEENFIYFITIFHVYIIGPLINTCWMIEWINFLVINDDKRYSKGIEITSKGKGARENLLSTLRNGKEKNKSIFFKIRLQVIFQFFKCKLQFTRFVEANYLLPF